MKPNFLKLGLDIYLMWFGMDSFESKLTPKSQKDPERDMISLTRLWSYIITFSLYMSETETISKRLAVQHH